MTTDNAPKTDETDGADPQHEASPATDLARKRKHLSTDIADDALTDSPGSKRQRSGQGRDSDEKPHPSAQGVASAPPASKPRALHEQVVHTPNAGAPNLEGLSNAFQTLHTCMPPQLRVYVMALAADQLGPRQTDLQLELVQPVQQQTVPAQSNRSSFLTTDTLPLLLQHVQDDASKKVSTRPPGMMLMTAQYKVYMNGRQLIYALCACLGFVPSHILDHNIRCLNIQQCGDALMLFDGYFALTKAIWRRLRNMASVVVNKLAWHQLGEQPVAAAAVEDQARLPAFADQPATTAVTTEPSDDGSSDDDDALTETQLAAAREAAAAEAAAATADNAIFLPSWSDLDPPASEAVMQGLAGLAEAWDEHREEALEALREVVPYIGKLKVLNKAAVYRNSHLGDIVEFAGNLQ